jgi:hypothetical protein
MEFYMMLSKSLILFWYVSLSAMYWLDIKPYIKLKPIDAGPFAIQPVTPMLVLKREPITPENDWYHKKLAASKMSAVP